MDPVEREFANLKAAEAQQRAKQQKDQQEHDEALALHRVEALEELARNKQMQWFLAECVKPLVDDEHSKALDIALPADQRNNHAQRHDIAVIILNLLDVELTAARNKVQPQGQK